MPASSWSAESSVAPLRLLACEAGRSFANRVAEALGQSLVPATESWFACGEGKLVIDANIRGSDVYVFQSCVGVTDSHSTYDRFVMLLHALEAARQADAMFVTAVLPYYPAARQDKRKGRAREGISAGLFARMLTAAGANRVISVEIHNAAIGGMFDSSRTTLETLYIDKHMAEWLGHRLGPDCVVVAPDVGGLERARRYAGRLQADLAALSKERDYTQTNRVTRSTLIGHIKGRNVLLVDDIVDTGGSVEAAIDELKRHGAEDITVACAHPVLSGPGWARLTAIFERAQREGWDFRFAGTSIIDHGETPPWYEEFALEPLLAETITRINSRGSVTDI